MAMSELRGFESLMAQLDRPKGRGGKSGHDPRGALNAAHRFLAKTGGSMHVVPLAAHLIGAGLWACGAKQPQNTLCVPLNADFTKGGGPLKVADAYDPKVGSIIIRTAPNHYAIRKGSPEPKTPDTPDVPLVEYVVAIEAGRLADVFGVTKK